MGLFNVNFQKFMSDNLPHFMRKDNSRGVLTAVALGGLTPINDQLNIVRDNINFDLSFNGQKIYLQKVLNILFDTVLERIVIKNGTDILQENFITFDNEVPPPLFISFDNEGDPPVFLGFQSEFNVLADIIVEVPAAVTFDEDEMEAVVNKYRMAGRTFKIIIT